MHFAKTKRMTRAALAFEKKHLKKEDVFMKFCRFSDLRKKTFET